METRIGLYNNNFQKKAINEISEERICNIGNFNSIFRISIGPLLLKDEPLEKTYVLEINYDNAEREHRQELGAFSFDSMLCFDYAKKANQLAEEFCKENNLLINDHFNSWPEFQAVVSRN